MPLSDERRGAAIMVAAMMILPGLDVFAKLAGETLPALQVAWGRFAVQITLALPIAFMLEGRTALRSAHTGRHLVRGVLLAAATLFFFAALQFLPIADALTIFLVEPLIVTMLASTFLGETVGWRRKTAVGVGLIGAMLVIQPNFAEVGAPALLPLGTAVCFAFYLLLTRGLANDMGAFGMQALAGLGGLGALSLALVAGSAVGMEAFSPVMPDARELWLLFCLGTLAMTGHLLIVIAARTAQAATLAPLQYTEILSAAILGYLVFDDFPNALAWLGLTIIVGSGLFVWAREQAIKS